MLNLVAQFHLTLKLPLLELKHFYVRWIGNEREAGDVVGRSVRLFFFNKLNKICPEENKLGCSAALPIEGSVNLDIFLERCPDLCD